MKNAELHLVVLWHRARYKQADIIADVQQNLEIAKAYEIHWTHDMISDNLSRFYGIDARTCARKKSECGAGAFLLLVVRDNNPNYDFVETSRGIERVNTNIFNLKKKYRTWTGGGHKIHATNTVAETEHDATLLLGLNYADLQTATTGVWDGEITTIHRNLTGGAKRHGWNDISELFYTLNATCEYAVLRNAEILPENFKSDLHGDIDIIVRDYHDAIRLLNATPVSKHPYRVHCYVIVNYQKVYFDVRYVGDDYYCEKFENDMLDTRILNDKNIYVLSDKVRFYALVYHALVHKAHIAPDYYTKIHDLFVKLALDKRYALSGYKTPFDLYYHLLIEYMNTNAYTFVRPHDRSVFYSEKITGISSIEYHVGRAYDFTDMAAINCDFVSGTGNTFLSAYDADGTKLFIKVGTRPELYRNEYLRGMELWKINKDLFIKPMYYLDGKKGGRINLFVGEYVDAQTLSATIERGNLDTKMRSQFIADIYQIFCALRDSNVVHRDITPNNLVCHNGHLVLIDFQLAVCKDKYRELRFLKDNGRCLAGLGTDGFRYKKYVWDDSYSLLKVLEYIGRRPEYGDLYDRVHTEIDAYIGKDKIAAHTKDILRAKAKRFFHHLVHFQF